MTPTTLKPDEVGGVVCLLSVAVGDVMRGLLSPWCFLGVALLGLVGCQKPETPPIEWRLQSHAVSTANDFKELQVMADSVRRMSGGRFVITPISGEANAIAVGPDIFAAVSEGRVEMGNGWPNWWSGQHPAWAVMNAGPFDFMNIDASLMFFMDGEGTRLANELSLPKGVMWRPAWWAGMEFGLLSKTEITSLNDLHGKKVRIGPGLPREVLAEASGAFAISTIPAEIRPALASGDLDAVEWTTTSGAWDLGLQDISPYAIVPAIWQPSVLADFLINKKAYDALPDDLKAILDSAIKAYTLTTTVSNKINDIAALKKFRDSGTVFHTWSDDDMARWRVASDETYRKYKEANDFSRRLIESKQAFKQRYDDYYLLFGPYDRAR